MVWKTRKFGVNNGRTIRSKFGRSRFLAKRSEGLLIQTLSEEKQDEDQSVSYSLGKQNRWLLPEVIKTSSVQSEEAREEPEDVILVERFTNEGNEKSHRPDCFSVFNSTDGTTREAKRRLARMKDLLSHIDSMKTRYEITYPHPNGSWHHERKRNTGGESTQFGIRKKSSFVSWTIEEEFEEFNHPGTYYQVDEDDFTDLTCQTHSNNMDRSYTFDLGSFISSSSKKTKKSLKKKTLPSQTDSGRHKEPKLGKGEAIYIDSGNVMHDAHEEFLAQIRETSSHMMDREAEVEYWQPPPGRGRGRGRGQAWGRGRWRGYRRNYRRHHIYEEALPSSDLPSVSPVPNPSDEPMSLLLSHQEISAASLEENWGKKYVEGTCLPRAFVLSATPQTSESSGEEVFVLFQLVEDCLEQDASQVKASVSTVVVSIDENVHELVSREFISWIKVNNAEQETWLLKDVVNIATNCFKSVRGNKTTIQQPRKPRLALDVFTELFGWNSEIFPLETAQQEVKKILEEKIRQAPSENSAALVTTVDHHQQTECGICFTSFCSKELDEVCSHTSLNACGHKFCDDCWKAHLRTQIQLGHTDLKCPGHVCTTAVDDITLMSLLPSWYGRHFTKRLNTILETNPEWKWCPADQCKLVVKTATPHDLSVGCDEHAVSIQPVPVVCVCGNMWCFKCQKDAHWPATCEEARIFREKNQGYAKMVERSQTTLMITSVMVKNCPNCHYPIEKHLGCPHMFCGLCGTDFCWDCLEKMDIYTHVCKTRVGQRAVELPANTKHLRTYEHFAVTSRMARSVSVMRGIHKKLDELDKGLQIYEKLSLKEGRGWSGGTKKYLNRLYERNFVQDVQEMFSFKYQALLAQEGLAIVLSFMKHSPSKPLVLAFERLLFILERMDEMLKDLNKCHQKETLERLKHLVKCGKECFIIISRNKK